MDVASLYFSHQADSACCAEFLGIQIGRLERVKTLLESSWTVYHISSIEVVFSWTELHFEKQKASIKFRFRAEETRRKPESSQNVF